MNVVVRRRLRNKGINLKGLKIFLLLVLLSFNAGCKQALKKETDSPLETKTISIPEDTVITLERGGCDGSCPIYKVIVFADGTTIFDGNNLVKELKVVRSKVSKDQLQSLLKEFDRLKFLEKNDDYLHGDDGCPEMWTDGFITNVSIQMNHQIKFVRHYDGCKGAKAVEELTALENKIDEILNTGQWIGERGERQWRQHPYSKHVNKKRNK